MKTSEIFNFQIVIDFKYELDTPKKGCKKRIVDIYEVGEDGKNLLYSELEVTRQMPGRTHSGIAGAVNLLHGLLYGNKDTYYLNDEYELLKEVAEHTRCGGTDCRKNGRCVGEHCNLFWKLRFKLLQLKVKFFNVFK